MANLILEAETEESVESRTVHVADRPIDFERFLDMAEGRWLELVDGVVVEIPMMRLEHERCSRWLYQVVGPFVQRFDLCEMLSSRIMVRTGTFGGRMPDLLFVSKARADIIQPKAVYGPPDLVVEIVSAGDRAARLRALESDYHGLGVPELVFIHLRESRLRHLRRSDQGYQETIITSGPMTSDAIPRCTLMAEWILHEPRPDVLDILTTLCSPG